MDRILLFVCVLFFLVGGIAHFVATDTFIRTVPDYLPNPGALVLVSGVFELAGAGGLLLTRTRRLAGYGLIVLCVAVFPANVHMALHPELFSDINPVLLYLRLPLQIVIIWVIWRATIRSVAAT